MNITRGIAICHYNRLEHLEKIIKAVKDTAPEDAQIVVCDDGSKPRVIKDVIINDTIQDETVSVCDICQKHKVLLIQGPNLGIAANKNRGLWALQKKHFICILEDDLIPIEKGWFETYEKAAHFSEINHFCRVQDKEIPETIPTFQEYMERQGLSPIYATSPRGDLTFITNTVVRSVGGFNNKFKGAGYAHGEWSQRVYDAGLISHPLKWVDIREARDKFDQIGDTEGGRWKDDQQEIRKQLKTNMKIFKQLKASPYLFHPLVLE